MILDESFDIIIIGDLFFFRLEYDNDKLQHPRLPDGNSCSILNYVCSLI